MRNEDIARDWRGRVVHPGPWETAPTQTSEPGICGGYEVWCESVGRRRAYLKPLCPGKYPTAGVADREKIASDLAYDLDIPVPPVVLYRRANPSAGEERSCCISLICYPRQFHWGLLLDPHRNPLVPALQEPISKHLPVAAAKALVFDTWVLQGDHDHPSNCAFGYDFRDLHNRGFVFFDYAYAFGFAVPPDEMGRLFDGMGEVDFPKEMKAVLDASILRATVQSVANYPEDRIREIVTRIPDDFLDPQSRAVVADGLVQRRTMLEAILAKRL